MKKRFLLVVSLVFIMLLTLSSCVKEVYNFEINKNGGSVKHEQIITKEVYDTLISMGEDPSEFEEDGYKLTFYTENNVEYVKATESKTFESLYDLNKYLNHLGDAEEIADGTDLSDEFFKHTKIEADEEGKILSMTGVVGKQNDISLYTSCTIIFNFAGEIIDYNIGEKIDDNTLKIDMIEIWEGNSSKIFKIETEIPSGIGSSIEELISSDDSVLWIILILVLVAVVISVSVLLAVVIGNKKQEKSLKNNDKTPEEILEEETTSN